MNYFEEFLISDPLIKIILNNVDNLMTLIGSVNDMFFVVFALTNFKSPLLN